MNDDEIVMVEFGGEILIIGFLNFGVLGFLGNMVINEGMIIINGFISVGIVLFLDVVIFNLGFIMIFGLFFGVLFVG